MLIKRVVIQGFKTFASRTEFLFDPGVTAVVGPNGSGKSNIVDAIRWCLGEQSFGLLRSKKTSDVIFSGSDKRARLSMAQVSLTLDNSNGEIPLDFAEVEVTRRAYRDGDNEYLLNGQRVRLQDIGEILAQTGLGKRTYAVIGQGLIDRVLNLAPEERRSLFEEAAGITNYQVKRNATLHRLEATQQNLNRVQDIIAELSPRVKQLQRQAERAREYEQLAATLRGLLYKWYGYRWHTTLQHLQASKIGEEQIRQQVAVRQQVLAEFSQRITTLREQQASLRGRLGELHKESSGLHREAEAAGRELAVASERLRQMQARQEEAQRELAPLHLEQVTLTQRLAEVEAVWVTAQAEHTRRQQAVEAMQSAVNQRQQERINLQAAVDAARRDLSQLQSRMIDCASRLRGVDERRQTLGQEWETQQQAHNGAELEVASAQQALQQAEAQTQHEEAQAGEIQRKIAQLEQTLLTLRKQVEQAEEQRQLADRASDRLQTRHDLLRRLRDEGAGYASGVRAVLQASQEASKGARLLGVLGTVASLVRVPAHLDTAIETALGGALQNIVTQTWDDARQAIEFLKNNGRGRATFLPLDRLSVLSALPAPRLDGVLGNAADLVEYDPRIEKAVWQLLNRVWITQDLNAARAALDKTPGNSRPTVVTLGGEIIRPGGSVTGGNDNNRRDESMLARERELRELPAQMSQTAQKSQAAAATCAALNRQTEAAQLQMETEQHALAELARQERQQRQQSEALRRRLDRAQQAIRWQQERLAQMTAELETLRHKESALQAEQAHLQSAETTTRTRLAQAEAIMQAAGIAELLQTLADLRAAAAETSGHLRSQQALLENQKRNLQSITDQIRAKTQRIATLGEESGELSARIQQMSAVEAKLSAQIEQLRQHIDPLEATVAQLAAEQTSEESKERAAQQALRQEEGAWNNAQLQLQRADDQIAQLRHDIAQDWTLLTVKESNDEGDEGALVPTDFVAQLPVLTTLPATLEEEVRITRARLTRLSNVNPEAMREYDEAASRHEFLTTQVKDLDAAATDLRKVLKELDVLMETALDRTFKAVTEQFIRFFQQLFNGGDAQLVLTEPNDLANTGVEIIARPPGKRPQSLALLSGGERTLTACALIFAILQVSPTPFCVLDEVDAALDEANVDRFRQTLDDLSNSTQFIIVTHNRRTLEGANTIYGITMGNDGVSKVISLRLEGDKIVQNGGATAGNLDKTQLAKIEELVKM
ncbi:MAG: chromosome segregation protein SMC [Chloroflexi bacterium]|nr:chromosome segregation protein SMC [Chloroflexota bacterium]